MNWIWWFHFSYFQETYDSRLNGRYGNDPSTHQILIRIYGWRHDRLVDSIEIGCIDSPTLRSRTCGWPIVSQTLGACNWYRAPSLRSLRPYKNIWPILIKKIYKRLSTDYEELRRMIMDMRSQIGATCAPPFWPYGPRNDQPPPLSPLAPLLF